MESVPLTFGLEDEETDVECLLVEPQGHVSIDSVLCFSDKIPQNSMSLEEVPCSFGGSNSGIANEGKDFINREVLDVMHTENQVGYYRLQNDFHSMGENFFLGDDFAEPITNLDFVSTKCTQTLVSESPVLASNAANDTPWKSDIFRIMNFSDHSNDQLSDSKSEMGDVHVDHNCDSFAKNRLKSPTSCSLENIDKFHDISSSFDELFSDENDGSLSISSEGLHSPNIEKNDEFGLTDNDVKTKRLEEQNALPAQECFPEAVPMQKRSRKPTQRYIDELADSLSKYPKKRRGFSSSTIKDKSLMVKNNDKSLMGSKAMKPAEESSVIAIQVPFASIDNKDFPKDSADDMADITDTEILVAKPKENRIISPQNQKKRGGEHISQYNLENNGNCVAQSQKKKNDTVTTHLKNGNCEAQSQKKKKVVTTHLKKKNARHKGTIQKKKAGSNIDVVSEKRVDLVTAVSTKKKDDSSKRVDQLTAISPKKMGICSTAARKKKSKCLTAESPEEVSGRRKHHILWTMTEVRNLIDGVSQNGVGRWSRIKKLMFSSSPHRTSVDLKDKWRNLLKASGVLEPGGEKKRNQAWRPLPESIMHRVCELATKHPYPRGQIPKITHTTTNQDDESPDSTHITLSDYKKILRSIN